MQNHLIAWRHRKRGNVLMIIFAMVFVMITLVAGLHYRQSSARAVLFSEEAHLQARVAAEYELAKLGAPNATFQPPDQAVSGQNQHAEGFDLPPEIGKTIFSEEGVMDLGKTQALPFDNRLQGRSGLSWNQIKPQSSSPSIQPDKSQYLGVVSTFFPYVAYAPQGTITCDDTFGWRNQLFDNPLFPPDKAHSGGPVKMAARGDLNIKGNCAYGELFSREGTIKVGSGRVLAFRGNPPNLAGSGGTYANVLVQQINQARSELSNRALDKTSLFNGQEFGLDFVFKLLGGSGNLNSLLSLRQAMNFPFLMIPGGNTLGLVTNIWLHVPYAPDGSSTEQGISSTNDAYNAQIKAKSEKVQEVQAQIEAIDKKIQEDGPSIILLQEKSTLEAQLQALGNDLKSLNESMNSQLESAMASSTADSDMGPASRSQEGGLTKDGRMGWAYGPVFSKILSILGNLISGQFEDLAKDFSKRVRLVHFGHENHPTDFLISDSAVQMSATFNVPPGRALKLRSDLTIRGDLWLMRGSTLVIDGNLNVVSPQAAASDDPQKPQGKIYMEEGANLVVSGNLRCQGGPKVGSVLVGAPYEKLHPVMGSMLVGGDIDIPYAVLPAFSMADVDSKLPNLELFHTAVFTVLPNLAKMDGPFHQRKPYFATYATTFQIWTIPGPWGVIIIPTPIPLPTPKNINNPIFRVLTIIYTTQMNLAWGEHFLTHCDWWFLGEQVVPMWPKVDPTGFLDQVSNLPIPNLPGVAEIENLLVDQAKKFVTEMVTQLVASVVPDLVTQQMGFPISLIADFAGKLLPLDEWVNKLLSIDALQGPLGAVNGVNGVVNTLQSRLNNLESLVMMHETPGLLLYAGGRLTVASQAAADPPPLTVGMLVAQGDVVSNARMTVGCAISLGGNVSTKNLLYDPNVTRCSLYLPRSAPSNTPTDINWLDWALEVKYGEALNSNEAMDIGPQFRHVTVEGWKQ